MIKITAACRAKLWHSTLTAFATLVLLIAASALPALACTNVLIGRYATADHSTYITYSCDSCVYSAIRIEPAAQPSGGSITLYEEPGWGETPTGSPAVLGSIPQVQQTYRYIDILTGPMFAHIGGMNEHGVSVAESTIYGARNELANSKGWLSAFSTQPTRALMSLALQRAQTAREAIATIGTLAEAYGYHSLFSPDGEQLAIADTREVWSMEIFGPGPDWSPGSTKPGAVWCAQRIPDNHVAVSANRSRIGAIDLTDPDRFLASPNVHSLAKDMKWWSESSGEPFVWYEVYAPSNSPSSISREWRVLSYFAPSLKLSASDSRFPFSVQAELAIETPHVWAIQRDTLEGTPFDATAHQAFQVHGTKSPMACPTYFPNLYNLLGIKYRRTINLPYTSHSCVFQANDMWPTDARGCAWFGFGQAATSCYVPIYSGTTSLPSEWGTTGLTTFDDSLPFWSMQLPGQLAIIEWQNAYPDIAAVRDKAEMTFLDEQPHVLGLISEIPSADVVEVARLLNDYAESRLEGVKEGYGELADYLLSTYYIYLEPAQRPQLPEIPIFTWP